MTSAGGSSGLFHDEDDYVTFREALAPYADLYKVNLKILVWGPGETAQEKWWVKRADLVESLKQNNPEDEVKTSEDLFQELGEPPIEYGRYEIHHAEVADIIIALVLASPGQQGGVYRELEIIADRETLRDKTHIFLPKGARAYLQRFAAGQLSAYRRSHKYEYAWSFFNTCEKVTATSLDIVEEERKQRMYRKREIYLRTR